MWAMRRIWRVVERMGGGWRGEEAGRILLYYSLKCTFFFLSDEAVCRYRCGSVRIAIAPIIDNTKYTVINQDTH